MKAHVQTCGLLPQSERGPANRTAALKAMPAAERTRPAPLFFRKTGLLGMGSLGAVGCAMAVQAMVSGFNSLIRQEFRDHIY